MADQDAPIAQPTTAVTSSVDPVPWWFGLRDTWPVTYRHLQLLGVAIAAAITLWTTVGLVVVNVYEGTWLHDQETRVNTWLESVRTDTLTELSHWGSRLADTEVIITFAIIFAATAVVVSRRWIEALFVVGSLATQAAVFLVATLIVDRDRPPVERLDGSLPTASFPSGHTGAAVAFYGSLIVVALWHLRHQLARYLIPLTIAAIPVSVMASRLYRGMHYPSDVVAGTANGIISILVVAYLLGPAIAATRHATTTTDLEPKVGLGR